MFGLNAPFTKAGTGERPGRLPFGSAARGQQEEERSRRMLTLLTFAAAYNL